MQSFKFPKAVNNLRQSSVQGAKDLLSKMSREGEAKPTKPNPPGEELGALAGAGVRGVANFAALTTTAAGGVAGAVVGGTAGYSAGALYGIVDAFSFDHTQKVTKKVKGWDGNEISIESEALKVPEIMKTIGLGGLAAALGLLTSINPTEMQLASFPTEHLNQVFRTEFVAPHALVEADASGSEIAKDFVAGATLYVTAAMVINGAVIGLGGALAGGALGALAGGAVGTGIVGAAQQVTKKQG